MCTGGGEDGDGDREGETTERSEHGTSRFGFIGEDDTTRVEFRGSPPRRRTQVLYSLAALAVGSVQEP